eukprot:NODE_1439_length_1417_cov_18.092105_g1196_i0.p1 GENE.NODE_1439_length_1417_cov_18.092105_g1196_i0~~NODE_1439_length_1417_cov_18.092105_g1196_i0.p1  ORF type:complete len:440 (+),score=149.39 NODE_1439_length_1417_cov_18.092105_g1196_i0:65-1384(+)
MGNQQAQPGGSQQDKDKNSEEKKKWEPPPPPTVGKHKRIKKGLGDSDRLMKVTPSARCKLKLRRLERVMDYLTLEQEFLTAVQTDPSAQKTATEDEKKVEELCGMPQKVASLEEMIDDNHAIISVIGEDYVNLMSFVDKELIEPGCQVLVHNKTHNVIGILSDDVDPLISVMKVEKADRLESFGDIGGLEDQIQELKETVELPLTHPELYQELGIDAPKGVVLYGPPGTGKTMLARAVAHSTSCTFLRLVGSELIQKYLGEGPKLVRNVFQVAEDNAPSIVFIDEIDAIGTKRVDASSSGEKEIQRTMLELLNQLDGFDSRVDVKIILATNRIEALDPALIRPGRIDRKIFFPLPNEATKRSIFDIHTKKMSLAVDVDLEEFIMSKDDMSGADIKAICTEGGLIALRERRMKVCQSDLRKGKENVMYRKTKGAPPGMYL